jgi:hypothetical protein
VSSDVHQHHDVIELCELLNWDQNHPDQPRLPVFLAIRATHAQGGADISKKAWLALRRGAIPSEIDPSTASDLKRGLLGGDALLRAATSAKLAENRKKSKEIAGPYRHVAKLLVIWIDTWLRAGRNDQKWAAENPAATQGFLRSERTYAGRSAINVFATLVESPLAQSLFRCPRCHQFKVNNGTRLHRVYCSRSCGWRTTATASVYSARKKIKDEKLRAVRKVLKKWTGGTDWKRFVAERTNVTSNWISYAIRRGDLTHPKK